MKDFNEFTLTFSRPSGGVTHTEQCERVQGLNKAIDALIAGIKQTTKLPQAADIGMEMIGRALLAADRYRLKTGDAVCVSYYAEGLEYDDLHAPNPRQGYSVTVEFMGENFLYSVRGFVYSRRNAPTDAVDNFRTRLIRANHNMGITVKV
jgi:hypothetical protein